MTTAAAEYVIDGNELSKSLESYQVDTRMLPGQVFDIVEKRLVKGLLDEIDRVKPHTVRFVNLEGIASGPHIDFVYAIFGGLAELMDSLVQKKITITGTIRYVGGLPWNLIYRIDKKFEGYVRL